MLTFSREFYILNLAFARRIHQISKFPLEFALRVYTNLYVHFGLPSTLEPLHPVWQEYISGLRGSTADEEWTYQFALMHGSFAEADAINHSFGCFSYSLWKEKHVRLHFHNAEEADISPLSEERRDARLDEIYRMLSHINRQEVGVEDMVGSSWLYYLEA